MASDCLHRYRLRDLSRKKGSAPYLVYICTKQDCSHNIRVELVDGKLAECNRCESPFVMKLSKLKHGQTVIVRPHCDACTRTPVRFKKKRDRVKNTIDALMDSILPKSM